MADVLTSSEAAKLCGVSFRTVLRWIERGELQAYRLPGRGDHRVPVAELRRFMRAHAIPEPPEMQEPLPRRVLIAEDEPAMAKAMARVLKQAGFETTWAEDGFQAGLLVNAFRPGVITLDLRMPGIDGFSVLQTLKDYPPPFPCKVLVVSGESPERLQEALAAGADGVLAKPFANPDLVAEIERLLGQGE